MKIAVAAAAGAALSCVAAAISLSGSDSANAELVATARALVVAAPFTVGCYAWHRRPGERFGPLLIATGFGWFLTTLAESDDSLLYSIGRVAAWLVELELVYLVLSFPTGRLPERIDRLLVGATAALVALLYLPTALISDSYPLPAPYTTCEEACPANAFFILDSEPGLVDSVVRPLRDLATVVLFLAATARIGMRVQRATPSMRRILNPVLAVAVARLFLLPAGLVARRLAPDSWAVDVAFWTLILALPAMSVAFFLGLLRGRLFAARALETLGTRLHAGLPTPGLRATLAEALEDPSLRLAYRVPTDGGRWVDADGRPVELPAPGSGQCVTEVRGGDLPIAAIVHDEALREQQGLVDAAASYARMALENQRLGARVEASLRQADEERRRLERDLHDGAQQRLVALRIKLELTEELVASDPDSGLEKLHALGTEVDETLEELRSLARGVYPAVLADEGLPEALQAAALRAPVAAEVQSDGVGRYAREVESAVYFCCLEALQNVAKHARGATRITISLADGDALRFEVRDDGAGFDARSEPAGAGFTNMRDRLGALGGEVTIASEPGGGVVVSGSVPIERKS
jgi:signal transduction histidine kinase